MKNYTSHGFPFPKFRLLILCLMAFSAFTGCKKDDGPPPQNSNLSFIHAIPDVGPMDLYIDKNKGEINIPFGGASAYKEVTAGKHLITTLVVNTINEKVNVNYSFAGGQKFSVVGFGTNAAPQSLVIQDTVAVPGANKVWVRYLNLSPPANNASYIIKTAGSTGIWDFGARNFKTASSYTEYNAGPYNFDAFNISTGNNTPAASTGTMNFEGGKIYTLILMGTQGAAAPGDLRLLAVSTQ